MAGDMFGHTFINNFTGKDEIAALISALLDPMLQQAFGRIKEEIKNHRARDVCHLGRRR